ncbi:MAG: hypothetical protein AB1726_10450 [Planctomycetota bacterium]
MTSGAPALPPPASETRSAGADRRGPRRRQRAARVLAGASRRLAGGLAAWAPVWLPLAVLSQLALLGLRPVRAEEGRLALQEAELAGRVAALRAERSSLLADRRRLADGIYRERVRRSRRAAGAPPLTLERARAAEEAAAPGPAAAGR